jgi:hypothetical protein
MFVFDGDLKQDIEPRFAGIDWRTMSTYLFTVEDVFDIGGCYLIPVPGAPNTIPEIQRGSPVELRRPEGSALAADNWNIVLVAPYDPERPIQIGLQGLTKNNRQARTTHALLRCLRLVVADRMACPTANATGGGTALPTCRAQSSKFPWNTKSSGNP